MSVIDTIKTVVGLDSGAITHEYRCQDCDNEFESAKDPDRASCMNCMSYNVERVDN